MLNYFFLLMLFLLIVLCSLIIIYTPFFLILHLKARKEIAAWAVQHNYKVTKITPKLFCQGPFQWDSKLCKNLYFVLLEEDSKRIRHAYFKFGSFIRGNFTKHLEVKWR